MSNAMYDAKAGVLVLSADLISGLVAPGTLLNHIPLTQIYGDGKVVFIDPSVGSAVIHEGHLDARGITQLLSLLAAKDFFSFDLAYFRGGLTELAANVVTLTRHGQQEKRVSCYGGDWSAPPGFMDCYKALLYPQLQPKDVKTYVRQPISEQELAAGFYFGFEYQKKLNTPTDWQWVDAGRSSQWRRPEKQSHTVALDSGYMTPPIDGCRHICVRYTGDPAAAGATIQFDRNAMSPNQFGDIGITTRMYFMPQPATFILLHIEVSERLYAIVVSGYSGANLRLVVLGDIAHPSGGRLLVLDEHDAIQTIHPLQLAARA